MNTLKSLLLIACTLWLAQCTKKTSDAVDQAASNAKTAQAWRSSAPAPGPARNVELGDYATFDLSNGLKVIVVENHKLPRVSYQVSLLNDYTVEGDKAGLSSIAGNLLATGTATRSKSQIDELVDFYGANLNASGNGMFMSSLKKHSDKVMDVFTDILYNPSFPKEEFDKSINQTLSGLQSQKTDPNSISSNVAATVLYGANHPYGEVQTEKTIKNISLDDCKNFYKNYFVPSNAYLIIVGDVTEAEAKANAEKYFGKWKGGNLQLPQAKATKAPSKSSVAFANKDGAVQSVIRVTYPVDLQPGSPDLMAASVMNQILGGGGFSGRLMQNLREDKAYTYGSRSSLNQDPVVGSFSATASVRNEVTDSSVQEILYEMNRMRTELVSVEDLQLVKNSMAGSFARSLESPQTIANFARSTFKYGLPKDYYNTYLSRLASVTPADVMSAAQKYIKPENAYIVVVGSKDDVADKLLRFDGDDKIDYYGAYGEKINMDAVALPDGVTAQTVIADYINTIGGKQKLESVTTMVSEAAMDIMGQKAEVIIKLKNPNKFVNVMKMNGQVMQEQKFNGSLAMISGMGQKQVFKEGDKGYDEIKNQAAIFEQLKYNDPSFNLSLLGAEDFEGTKCYKVQIDKDGQKEIQYYSIKDNLLLATSVTMGGDEESPGQTILTKIGDYKMVDGFNMPHSMSITGAAPFPLNMNVTKYTFNQPLSEDEFMIKE